MNTQKLTILILILVAQISPLIGQTDATYLKDVRNDLRERWPNNRTINIVFHGHSVPSGYFVTPDVRKFESYPHLSLLKIKDAYPNAVVNSITTSIGGEQAERGETRFANEVLPMRPDVLFIDYALNDRGIGLERAKVAWQKMIDAALAHTFTDRNGNVHNVKVILMTPTPDTSEDILSEDAVLAKHSAQIRQLAIDNNVGLIDSYALFKEIARSESLSSYMAQGNHPNKKGHQVVADEIAKLFIQEETIPDGLYFIKGLFSGKFMTVEDASQANNAKIVVTDSANTENQKFWLRNTTNGFSLSTLNGSKALGLLESNTENGANLVQTDSTGSNNERYSLTYAGDDHYWLINKNSKKYIATPGTQNTNGTPVIQWVFFNNLNFQWQFIPAEIPDDMEEEEEEDNNPLSIGSVQNDITIFPNPALSKIGIVRSSKEKVHVILQTIDGKELNHFEIEGKNVELPLPENLTKGIYYLKFDRKEGILTKKLIVE